MEFNRSPGSYCFKFFLIESPRKSLVLVRRFHCRGGWKPKGPAGLWPVCNSVGPRRATRPGEVLFRAVGGRTSNILFLRFWRWLAGRGCSLAVVGGGQGGAAQRAKIVCYNCAAGSTWVR